MAALMHVTVVGVLVAVVEVTRCTAVTEFRVPKRSASIALSGSGSGSQCQATGQGDSQCKLREIVVSPHLSFLCNCDHRNPIQRDVVEISVI